MRNAVLIFLLAVALTGGHLMAGEALTGHISDAKCGAAHATIPPSRSVASRGV